MNRHISTAAEGLHGFWSWWSDEMAGMLPQNLRGDPTERDRFDIFLEADETVIEIAVRGEARKMLEPSAFADLPQESWDQIDDLAQSQKPRLFLSDADYLEIPVTMPRGSAGQIGSALALQLPTLSPIIPEQIEWGFEETGRNENDIFISLIIARISHLDALEEDFGKRGLMPPIFCARVEDKTITLRRPLELASKPMEEKNMVAAMAAAAMLAMIPIATIGGAELLASLNIERAQRLEKDLAPRLAIEKEAQREEMMRRAAAPLLNIPSAGNMLEALAQNLPASDWAVSSSQSPDGIFEFVADMADQETAEAAMREAPAMGRIEVAEEIDTENLRARVRYQVMR